MLVFEVKQSFLGNDIKNKFLVFDMTLVNLFSATISNPDKTTQLDLFLLTLISGSQVFKLVGFCRLNGSSVYLLFFKYINFNL
jgi:hypothetical protein